MALADGFVANRKDFGVIALTPFVVITLALVAGLGFVPPPWELTISGILLAHTAMCSGDFGLLSYCRAHRHRQVMTYDDVENRVSCFYGYPAPGAAHQEMDPTG